MKLAIHQPNYLPWIGFFDKMDSVDKFVLLDTAMYTRSEFINRNKVKTPDGWKWLTVPVMGKKKRIYEMSIDNSKNWRKNHWTIIHNNYKKSAFWETYSAGFEEIYSKNWNKLMDINIALINHIKQLLEIDTEIFIESDFKADFGKGNTRNINIVKKLNGTSYLSGTGGAVYNDKEKFEENNIELVYQNFSHPVYPQLWGDFQKNLSIIDMLFHCGPETIHLLRETRRDIN